MKRNPTDFRWLRKNLTGIIRKPHNILQHIKMNSYVMYNTLTYYILLHFITHIAIHITKTIMLWYFEIIFMKINYQTFNVKLNKSSYKLLENEMIVIRTCCKIIFEPLQDDILCIKVFWSCLKFDEKDVYHILKTKGASKLGRSSIYEFERLTW